MSLCQIRLTIIKLFPIFNNKRSIITHGSHAFEIAQISEIFFLMYFYLFTFIFFFLIGVNSVLKKTNGNAACMMAGSNRAVRMLLVDLGLNSSRPHW